MNWNNPNLWIILAVVGLSFLQWVVQRIREQAAINRAREAARRKNEEALRTGRAPEAAQREQREAQQTRTALDDKQRQAIERRQEQLRELRRKQMETQARARTRAGTGPSSAPARQSPIPPPASRVPTPQPSRPSRSQPAPSAQRPPSPAPQRAPARQPTPAAKRTTLSRSGTAMGDDLERISRLRQEEALRRQQMMRGTPSLAATPDAGDEVLRPALATFKGLRGGPLVTPDAHDATTSGAALLAGMDADDWRRGIILSEILREPVSMRDPLSRPSF
ncbi:MAG: hypothetical protein KF684_01770 [Phycisphaeraceae bacterium]|nr:hypothetical protein [Phycisphaeraceae bacterium]